jgi:hypothetical protein
LESDAGSDDDDEESASRSDADDEMWGMNDEPLTEIEIDTSLKADGDNTPGIDGFTTKLIAEGWSHSPAFRLQIWILFSLCFEQGVTPSNWKKAIIFAIAKPGKKPTLPKSYRPISLLSTTSKIPDRVVADRMQYFASQDQIISPANFRSVAGKSAVEMLFDLVSAIRTARR